MTCTKCKNPIEINATACEWCGISFSIPNNAPEMPKNSKTKIDILDSELLALLEQGKKKEARKLFQERTGANKSISRYKIAKLDFFRKHQYATEKTWDDYAKRSEKRFGIFRVIQLFLLFVSGLIGLRALGYAFGSIFPYNLLFLLPWIVFIATIIWMRNTKKI